ncbi:MAG: carboxypeptidase regulatory-like domain-containing protein [Acidobacteria bacterium]|nr:MAG: carboxypeptidase regulatory-like domain-containing protein [Acidobacteriota bacterium]
MQAIWVRTAALAAACLCSVAWPSAQQPSQPPPANAVIAGRVVDSADDKPIQGVTVALAGGAPGAVGRAGNVGRIVMTDSQGRFVFVGLTAGRYQILPQRSGYAALAAGTLRPIELAAEQKLMDLAVRLHRLASISGTVTDDNGDPVVGMGVIASRRTIQNGQVVVLPTNESRTDDRGAYRIANLATGDYVVCACRRDQMPVDGVLLTTLAGNPAQLMGLASRALKVGADAASIESARTFAPAFHPSGASMSRATHITLGDGDERTSIDIQVATVRSARISGSVIGAPGSVHSSSIRLRLAGEMPDSTPVIEPMLVQPDGRFDFVGVPAGSYVINVAMTSTPLGVVGPSGAALQLIGRGAMAPPPPPPPPAPPGGEVVSVLWGQASVVVGDADVTGVSVALRPAARVTVKFELPPMPPPAPNQPPVVRFVQLVPLRFESRGLPALGRLDRDGTTYVIGGVAPGRYGLFVNSALRMEKVTLRGDDVTDVPIEIGEEDISDLVVKLVPTTPTRVTGTVTGNFADTTALLFPADRRYWAEPAAARRWFLSAPVSRAGTFAADLAVPGDYLVIVLPDEQAVDWQIQARLETLAARAQKVTIAAGETKAIEVKR